MRYSRIRRGGHFGISPSYYHNTNVQPALTSCTIRLPGPRPQVAPSITMYPVTLSQILQRLPIITHGFVLVLVSVGPWLCPIFLAACFFLTNVAFVSSQIRMACSMIRYAVCDLGISPRLIVSAPVSRSDVTGECGLIGRRIGGQYIYKEYNLHLSRLWIYDIRLIRFRT
jgi:hypothetical protein